MRAARDQCSCSFCCLVDPVKQRQTGIEVPSRRVGVCRTPTTRGSRLRRQSDHLCRPAESIMDRTAKRGCLASTYFGLSGRK
jgi:hypothetical protein